MSRRDECLVTGRKNTYSSIGVYFYQHLDIYKYWYFNKRLVLKPVLSILRFFSHEPHLSHTVHAITQCIGSNASLHYKLRFDPSALEFLGSFSWTLLILWYLRNKCTNFPGILKILGALSMSWSIWAAMTKCHRVA